MKTRLYILFAFAFILVNTTRAVGINLSELDNTHAYYIHQGDKGYLYANGGKAYADGRTQPTADDAYRWAVVYNETLGAYFLYNLKDSTFLTTADGTCPLVPSANPVYLFEASAPDSYYAYSTGGVIGLTTNNIGGDILLQGENGQVPDALSFEIAGDLDEKHLTKINAAVWLAATEQTPVPVISSIGTRISSLSEIVDGGSYLLYSVGMSRYAYDTGTQLSFNASQPAKNNITAMPYVFTFHKVGNAYTIETGIVGNSISSLASNAVYTDATPTTFTITASSTAGSFNIYDTGSSQYINAQSAQPVGWGSSEGNSRYQLIPVEIENSTKYFPVTYLCYETDGEHTRLMDVQTYAKSTNRVTAPAFSGYKRLTTKAADGVSTAPTSISAPTVVVCTYQRNLRTPFAFVPTTITDGQFADTTRWYTVNVSDKTMEVQTEATGHYLLGLNEVTTINDNMLWCFVGNNVDGFQIYNRALGTTHALSFTVSPQNTDLPFVAEGDYDKWVVSNGGQTGYWYLSPAVSDKTLYLADDGQRKLSVMTSVANVVITEAATTMIDFASSAASNLGTNVGQYNSNEAAALTGAAEDYTLSEAKFVALQQAYNEFLAASERISIDRQGLYRIVASDGTALTAAIDAANPSVTTVGNDERNQLWRLLQIGNTNSYYLLNPENGAYLGLTSSASRITTMLEEPTTHYYNISNAGGSLSTWTLKDNGSTASTSYLTLSNDQTIVGGRATEVAATWSIVPVTEFVVHTNGSNDIAATTVYLPFAVKVPHDLLAAVITSKESESVSVTPIEGDVIPAYTPTLLISDAPSDFVLTRVDNVDDVDYTNLLVGVDKRQTTDSEQTFVLSDNAQFELGNGTLAAYTAFLDRETTEAAALALTLPTAIQMIQGEPNGSQIGQWYDLQGRPIQTPQRPGIFIYKGKKVFVQ